MFSDNGAAPEYIASKHDKSYLSTKGCLARNINSGGTANKIDIYGENKLQTKYMFCNLMDMYTYFIKFYGF